MIGIVLIGAVFMALLELNKNSLWGWIPALLVLAGFFVLYRKYPAKGMLGFLRWPALLAVQIGRAHV